MSLKAPTCVLLSPKQELVAFGYEAEDLYSELALEENHYDHYFFKEFKMLLYETNVSTTGYCMVSANRITGYTFVAYREFSVCRFRQKCILSTFNHLWTILHQLNWAILLLFLKFLYFLFIFSFTNRKHLSCLTVNFFNINPF